MESCWDILGIEKTKDKLEIKKAYAKLARTISPEDDPEGFQRIHDAYKQALRFAGLESVPLAALGPNGSEETEPEADSDSEETEADPAPDEDADLPFDFSSIPDPDGNLSGNVKYWTEYITDYKNACGIARFEDVLKWKPRTMLSRAWSLTLFYRNLYACSKDNHTWDSFFEEPLIRYLTLFYYQDFSDMLRNVIGEDTDEGIIIADYLAKNAPSLKPTVSTSELAPSARLIDKHPKLWRVIDIVAVVAFVLICLLEPVWENLIALCMGIVMMLAQYAVFRFLYLTLKNDPKQREKTYSQLMASICLSVLISIIHMLISVYFFPARDIPNAIITVVFLILGSFFWFFLISRKRKWFS